MDLSFDFINQNLIHPFKGVDDSKLKNLILEISHNFTLDRTRIKNYVLDAERVSAYSAFYFPTNVPKIFKVLDWAKLELDKNLKWHLYDVGCGPGSLSLGFVDHFIDYDLSVTLLDSSSFMLEQAKKFYQAYFPKIKIELNSTDKKENSIMLFGHSMNEMGVEKAFELINKINPEIILFIEPGTKEVFADLLKMRSLLVTHQYQINYPCPSNEQCPLAHVDDWCHQVLEVRHDPTIERLSQILHKDRRNLPIASFVFSKNLYTKRQNHIVRKIPENKFAYNYDLCLKDHQLKKMNVEVLKRALSKSEQKELENLLQGDELNFELEKKINEDKWRVKYKKEI